MHDNLKAYVNSVLDGYCRGHGLKLEKGEYDLLLRLLVAQSELLIHNVVVSFLDSWRRNA